MLIAKEHMMEIQEWWEDKKTQQKWQNIEEMGGVNEQSTAIIAALQALAQEMRLNTVTIAKALEAKKAAE